MPTDMEVLEAALPAAGSEPAADVDSAANEIVDSVAESAENTETNDADPAENTGEPETPADGPAEAETEPAAETKEDEVEGLEDANVALSGTKGLSIKGLNEQLAKSPEFKAALEANPELKSQLFLNARLADKAHSYDELFQSPVFAKQMKVAADEMYRADELYHGDNPEAFLDWLVSNSFEYDDNGNVLTDAKGKPVSDGSYERIAETWKGAFFDQMAGFASQLKGMNHDVAKADGEELEEALKVINRVVFRNDDGSASTSAKKDDLEGLPKHIADELRAARAGKQGQAQSNGQAFENFKTAVDTEVQTMAKGYAEGLIATLSKSNPKLALTDYLKKVVVQEALTALKAKEAENAAHRSTFGNMLKAAPRTKEGITALVNVKKVFYKENLPRLVGNALREATSPIVTTSQAKQGKINAQLKHRDMPSGGVSTPRPRPVDVGKLRSEAEKAKGKPLTDSEFTDAYLNELYGKK